MEAARRAGLRQSMTIYPRMLSATFVTRMLVGGALLRLAAFVRTSLGRLRATG